MTCLESNTVEAPVETLVAPARLTADHRHEFRRSVLEALEKASARGDRVVALDLGTTIEMDASGLGVLVLLQKRARERGLGTRLEQVPRVVLSMLTVTRLDSLFEVAARD